MGGYLGLFRAMFFEVSLGVSLDGWTTDYYGYIISYGYGVGPLDMDI